MKGRKGREGERRLNNRLEKRGREGEEGSAEKLVVRREGEGKGDAGGGKIKR